MFVRRRFAVLVKLLVCAAVVHSHIYVRGVFGGA
jgi:hypothetical protein